MDDSGTTRGNAWWNARHIWPLVRTRIISMALAGIMMIVIVFSASIPPGSASNENTTTSFITGDIKTSYNWVELDRGDVKGCKDGKYIGDLLDEADPTEECINFVN